MTLTRRHHRFTRALVATLATGLVLVAAAPTASAAAAVSCSSPGVTNGEGYAYMNVTANLKVAPYAECGTVAGVSSGTKVWLHCIYYNDYGNYWWYVRIAGTSTYGWMVEGKLDLVAYDDDGDGSWEPAAC
ncbi:hypothetical protein ABZ464_43420 [Streptomyces sp. NPDC005820]|uniref:hypothetical protein n=1 Tax=Streptomyces sp. NPDC005820 TaxID=3157069 RepID=UPI0033CADF10